MIRVEEKRCKRMRDHCDGRMSDECAKNERDTQTEEKECEDYYSHFAPFLRDIGDIG